MILATRQHHEDQKDCLLTSLHGYTGPFWALYATLPLPKKSFSWNLPVPQVPAYAFVSSRTTTLVYVWEGTKRLIILRSLISAGSYSPEGGVVFPKGSWPFGLESFRIPDVFPFWLKTDARATAQSIVHKLRSVQPTGCPHH